MAKLIKQRGPIRKFMEAVGAYSKGGSLKFVVLGSGFTLGGFLEGGFFKGGGQ